MFTDYFQVRSITYNGFPNSPNYLYNSRDIIVGSVIGKKNEE